jgi:ABC-type amino acid transport substrate-binding protein
MKVLVLIFLFIINIVAYSATVSVGVVDYAPPFSTLAADGKYYYGFVIELMGKICLRINKQCIYKSVKLGGQFDSLQKGEIDISFLPIPISSEHSEDMIYSLPYLASKGQFLTLEKNNINTLGDIKNSHIGVIKDTLYPILIKSQYASTNTIRKYENSTELFAGLASRDVDVIYVNATVGKYIINNVLQKLKPVGGPISMGEGYAIMALKKNADLIKEINKALLGLETDGTYLTIYNRYFSN